MKNRILIVDGSNLLFQMFFGLPSRIVNSDGVGIWGVIGFVGALLKMLRQTKPTHIAVLFDGEHENDRTSIDQDYKANRMDYSQIADEDNPFSQLPYIYQALDYLNIPHAETTSCEADDWIAGYVSRYANENEIIISSLDSDFFQLIGEHVRILRYHGEKSVLCDTEYLLKRYGITPCRYADFKSLTGDQADNIKGAEGIGIKTASVLIQEFGALDSIIKNAANIKKPSIRESILRNRQRLSDNYEMIYLRGAVEIPFCLAEMEYSDTGVSTTEVLRGVGLKK